MFDRRAETNREPFVRRAAAWATGLSWEDIPTDVRRAALAQQASTLGGAVWSVTHPAGEQIAEATERQYEPGVSAFLGGRSLTAEGAAYGNAALSMALDFDDTILGGHTGHSSVFTALAYAQQAGVTRERALVAQVAANEVAARVASAAAVGPFRGQQTAYIHALGAAVARAVVEGDSERVLRNALGIASAQPPWPLSGPFFTGDAKHWLASDPLKTGVAAVDAARSGQQGQDTVIEGESGFLSEFATIPIPAFLDGLGTRWHTRAVTVKEVPGCAYVTAPVEATLRIAEQTDVTPERVESVTVEASLFATEVDDRASPAIEGTASPLSALTFTVPYNVAVALTDGEHTPRQLAPARVEDAAVWELAERVTLRHDEELTLAALDSEVPVGAMLRPIGLPVVAYAAKTVGPVAAVRHLPTLLRFARKRPLPGDLSGADKQMGARVAVETTDGRVYVSEVSHPSGFAGHPLDDILESATTKYREALLERGLSAEAARRETRALLEFGSDERVTLPGGER
jgi:2-methylcitrate dehydratase PrpD